ncbi:hypothetical protein C7445_1195 [Alicyclobacillus sacchari]|uniref:Uncharacterized protein n=1 Tax=Alicyclobacillus sacchari TaxID=392010 RepID=A0A4R8LDD7_9BACL|nr:hypothetical protein C7445_1195 [Alicyclobacillus sacchari]
MNKEADLTCTLCHRPIESKQEAWNDDCGQLYCSKNCHQKRLTRIADRN